MATIHLDVDRSLKWTMRAEFRLGSLPKPPELGDIASNNRRKAFFALCCHLWACLEDSPSPEPVGLAEYLETPEKQVAAIKALHDALVEAGRIEPAKKETAPTGKQPGPSGSSNSAAPPRTSGT